VVIPEPRVGTLEQDWNASGEVKGILRSAGGRKGESGGTFGVGEVARAGAFLSMLCA